MSIGGPGDAQEAADRANDVLLAITEGAACDVVIDELAGLTGFLLRNGEDMLNKSPQVELDRAETAIGELQVHSGKYEECLGPSGPDIAVEAEGMAQSISRRDSGGLRKAVQTWVDVLERNGVEFGNSRELACVAAPEEKELERELESAAEGARPHSVSSTTSQNGQLVACVILEEISDEL